MTHLQKCKSTSILKWASSSFGQNQLNSSKSQVWSSGYSFISPNTRLYRTKRVAQTEDSEIFGQLEIDKVVRIPRAVKKEAQAALLEYFYSTRNLQFLDAENMSRNSPLFLSKLLKQVNTEAEIGRSIARFLCYHPVNEFEPFLESLGLKPSEYAHLLPRNLMYLTDARLLLENYYVLCGYGFARHKIGKIYKGATEVFHSDVQILVSKLRGYEKLGFSQSTVVKLIISSPYLLIGNVNADFTKVLERIKNFGFETRWFENNLLEDDDYNWSRMLELLCLFSKMGLTDAEMAEMLGQHPDILFEDSGDRTILLIGFLLKFGYSMNQIGPMFLQFPQVQVGKFVSNLRRCFGFLNEIEMETTKMGNFLRSHTLLVGSCCLKSANSLLTYLCVGKKRLCSYIQKNPHELKNFVLGAKVERLPSLEEDSESKLHKNKFLLNLGYVEDSNEMKKALKVFRGKGGELQERFDFIMSYGLEHDEVREMVKVSPQILNQTKSVIQTKIDLLVKELGYPISALWVFPSLLNYTVERVKHRVSMYDWLKSQGMADPVLALSTIVACSETQFVKQYVNRHPNGPEAWQDLKKKIFSKQTNNIHS
uniref:Transcription termination factor MTEF18, mitochondrial-like n=1 Tax=Cannabis sativa TaxID=3483 RepID=A0A803QP45_CANSA